jgi:hypothetical protein
VERNGEGGAKRPCPRRVLTFSFAPAPILGSVEALRREEARQDTQTRYGRCTLGFEGAVGLRASDRDKQIIERRFLWRTKVRHVGTVTAEVPVAMARCAVLRAVLWRDD